MKPVIFVSPHRGVNDFLWGDTHGPDAFEGYAGLVTTASLGLSDALVREFAAWVDDWHENFVGRDISGEMRVPVWREGFDSAQWVDGGWSAG